MELRDARRADLPRILEIYNATIPGRLATADTAPVALASRQAWFDAHGGARPLWVVEEGGEVSAWLSFSSFYGRPAYDATVEISLYVDEGRQRRGVGRHLLAEAIARAPALGVTTLLAFIFGHNEPSLRLFEAHGFARWGELPRVARLDDVERDLVILGLRVE